MSQSATILQTALEGLLRRIIREEIQALMGRNGHKEDGSKGTANPYLTIKEAADISRLGPSTVRLLIRKRELKALQVGRRVIIKRSDLESYLEANPIEVKSDEIGP